MNKLNSKVNYPTTLGIEYALIPKGINPNVKTTELDNKLSSTVKKIDSRFSKSKNWAKYIYNSPSSVDSGGKHELGAIEYSSVPLKSSEEVKEFYEYTTKLFNYGEKVSGFKFVPNTTSRGVYIEGGGLHIHLGTHLEGFDELINTAFRRNIAIFMLSNPILQWCCADWADDCILTSTYFNAIEKENKCRISEFSSQLIEFHLENYSSGWGRGPTQIRNKESHELKKALPTIEFRCFGAPDSFETLMDYVDLAMAVWKYCLGLSGEGVLATLAFKNVGEIAQYYKEIQDNPAKEWEHFIRSMNLDYKRYKKYLKNFQWRKDHGMFYSYDFAGLE